MPTTKRKNITSIRKQPEEQIFGSENPLPNDLLDTLEDYLIAPLVKTIKKNLPTDQTASRLKDDSLMFIFSYDTTHSQGLTKSIPAISVQVLCAKTRFSNIACLDIETTDWEEMAEYEIIFNSQYLYRLRYDFVSESSLSDCIVWEEDDTYESDPIGMQIDEIIYTEMDYIDECLQIQKEQDLKKILPPEIYEQLKPYFKTILECFETCYFLKAY